MEVLSMLTILILLDIRVFIQDSRHLNVLLGDLFLNPDIKIHQLIGVTNELISTFSVIIIFLQQFLASLLPVSLRVDVLLLDESLSSLFSFSDDVVSSLREQIA
jgi:hypothetical protein